jgi:hypothetical protein
VKRLAALAFLILLFNLSCARKEGESTESRTAAGAAPSADQEGPDQGAVVSKREITLAPAAPAENAKPAALRQTAQDKLLTLKSIPVLPEDFKIGPLAELVELDRNSREMVSAASRFLDALREGTVPVDLLLAGVREELSRSIDYYLEQDLSPLNYRLGAITTDPASKADQSSPALQQTAWMNVRLFGSPGVAEGEMYLQRSGGRWYVSDLQINFEELGQSYAPEQEKYYPSTYGWGIE